jgi:hypothetical protein
MDGKNSINTLYLTELYRQTDGNTESRVTMSDVGAAIGLEKNEAGKTAEDLIISGFVEMKTLSGDIGITPQGLEKLGLSSANITTENTIQLGNGLVLDAGGLQAVDDLLAEIKTFIAKTQTDYTCIEECIIDIKTIETQLLSPRPKVEIIREVLKSLSAAVSTMDNGKFSRKLDEVAHS